jgi:nucleoside-diphosphate-sugar epimerase
MTIPRRASPEQIEKRRADRAVRFLLTGGTGFLGSHIAVELLRRGHRVTLLARRDKDRRAEERVQEILDWFGLPASERHAIRVVEGDITQDRSGVDRALLEVLVRETDEVIHCASNTAFSERKRAAVEAVNGGGLANVLDFARASRAYFFHHVSTAYVAGKSAGGLCPEELVAPREFWNVYEETKCRGEHAAAAACREAGLGLTIYRPSIVYGDSRTGRSRLFNAVYFPVRTAVFFKDLYKKDIRERGGRKAAEMGVRIEPDGSLHLPLRIEVANEGGLDLIPVDHFTAAFQALMEEATEGGVFHITNGRPTRVEDIIDFGSRLFHLAGIRACSEEEFKERPRNPLETLYEHYVEAYGPYMKDRRVFESTRSGPIRERRGLVCPKFDFEVFARCMTYAVETGWGARLRP